MYGRGLLACSKGQVRPWIAMQLLGGSLDCLIDGALSHNRTLFLRYANQMLTASFPCS